MKKAIVNISEGLGNQLFMYAHAYAFSKKKGYKLFVDSTSSYKNLKIRNFLLDNFNLDLNYADADDIPDNFFKNIKFKIDKNIDKYRSRKKFLIEKREKNKTTKFQDYTNINFADNLFIKGYFESEKYFEDYKNDIIKKFTIKNINLRNLCFNPNELLKENSVSIVIRQHRFSEKIKKCLA